MRVIIEHDTVWRARVDRGWMTWYSLADHSEQVGIVMDRISRARRRSERLIDLSRTAGKLHDIGKVDVRCEAYRRDGCITEEERLGLRRDHPIYSEEWLVKFSRSVRESDMPFINDLRPIVLYHHLPWEVEDPTLREICIDLHLADIFVSRQETRYKSGLSQFQALQKLEKEVHDKKHLPEFAHLHDDLDCSLQVIRERFGPDLDTISAQLRA